MIYVIDIDGVICEEESPVPSRSPYDDRIRKINELYDAGNIIIYLTARGMNSQKNNQKKADEKYRELTEAQLKGWGCKYHELYFGKPNADVYVDNKNMLMNDFFSK